MDLNFNIFSGFSFLGSLITAVLSIICFQRRTAPAAKSLMFLLICSAIYGFGAGFEYMGGNVSRVIFWTHIEYLGIAWTPTAVILFSIHFSSLRLRNEKLLIVLLSCLSLTTMLIQFTTLRHELFYINPRIITDGPIPTLVFERGIFYTIHNFYMIASFVVIITTAFIKFLRSSGLYKRQTLIILLSSCIPIFGYFLYILRLTPANLDIGPLTFPLMGLATGHGILYGHLFDFIPIANKAIFNSMQEGCIIFDNKGRVVNINSSAKQIFPSLKDTDIGNPLPAEKYPFEEFEEIMKKDGRNELDIVLKTQDLTRCYNVSVSPILDKKLRALGKILLFNDTSRQYQLAEQLRYLATRDELTGLLTRRHFFELAEHMLSQACRNKRPLSVIIMDLDFFKSVNDSFGHQTGDTVLSQISAILMSLIRSYDLLCRYGGEEFLLLLPETHEATALEIAERIRKKIQGIPQLVESTRIETTLSLGVAGLTVVEPCTLKELIRRADTALYKAKNTGRNRTCVYSES